MTVDYGSTLLETLRNLESHAQYVQVQCYQFISNTFSGNSTSARTRIFNSDPYIANAGPPKDAIEQSGRPNDAPKHRRRTLKRARLVMVALPIAASLHTIATEPPTISDTECYIIAGTLSRTFAQTCIHPIDTVKTRLQVSTPSPKLVRWQAATATQCVLINLPHKNICLPNLIAKGPADLYLGLTGSILGTLPTAFLYFTTYEQCKAYLQGRLSGPRSHMTTHLLSASAGALASSLVRVPTDNIRHKVQAYLYPNVMEAAVLVVQKSGIRGLYSGFAATLIRDIPEIAIQFALYDRLRRAVHQQQPQLKLKTWQHLVLGGVAGAAAASFTTPLDVLKTSLQTSSKQVHVGVALERILQVKGWRGLFSGMAPRVAQTALMSAIFFTAFDVWKQYLKPPPDSPLEECLDMLRLEQSLLA